MPATVPTRKDRVISKIVALLSMSVFREVAVHGLADPPTDGPELSLSNHFGGLSDGIVLLHALPRRPGIIARDVIWKIPIAGRLMTWIGGIPVHQPEDGGRSSNDQMFSSCYDALRQGRGLLIFPEGLTRDEPSIGRVKTGAARIALGARATGVDDLVVTPIGIHYEDKAALRSRVVVIGGPPLRLDAEVAAIARGRSVGPDDREVVAELTSRFDIELRRVAPDYVDWREARRLQTAAEVTLRSYPSSNPRVSIGQRDRLANALADRPVEARRDICDAVERYEADLEGLGLDDASFVGRIGTRRLVRKLVVQFLIGMVLLPFAVAGVLLNAIPFLIVKAVGLLRVSPAVLASLKPAVAFLAFGLAWGLEAWAAFRAFGVTGLAAAVILIPTYGIAAIVVLDRAVLAWRLIRRWRATARSRSLDDALDAERAAVVDTVLSS
ncbi:1-acyl-sn-glycerol-3-phosphate acyltransferase [Ilumatobacter sp.]|uniref:1-acyl-sn-glycerol-3-phosphate acyltransferase n=1 Tax=Ilumatobacter sp. TaxID=1967498 RepID=UPI003AF6FDBD